MAKRELIDIACQVRGETDGAYRIFDGTRTEWVPKSQVEISEPGAGAYPSDVTCTMPMWLAKEKGFI